MNNKNIERDILNVFQRHDGPLSKEQIYYLSGKYPEDDVQKALIDLVDKNHLILTAEWRYVVWRRDNDE